MSSNSQCLPLNQVRILETFTNLKHHAIIMSILSGPNPSQVVKKLTKVEDLVGFANDVSELIARYIGYLQHQSIQVSLKKFRQVRLTTFEAGCESVKSHPDQFRELARYIRDFANESENEKDQTFAIVAKITKQVDALALAIQDYNAEVEKAKTRISNDDSAITDDEHVQGTNEDIITDELPVTNQTFTGSGTPLDTSVQLVYTGQQCIQPSQEGSQPNQVHTNANIQPSGSIVDHNIVRLDGRIDGLSDQIIKLRSDILKAIGQNNQPSPVATQANSFASSQGVTQGPQSGPSPASQRNFPTTGGQVNSTPQQFGDYSQAHSIRLTPMNIGISSAIIEQKVQHDAGLNTTSGNPCDAENSGFTLRQSFRPELPEFSGLPGTISFVNFWNFFRNLVHDQSYFDESQKAMALLQKVKPPASDLLCGNIHRPGGYIEAVQRLLRSYGPACDSTAPLIDRLSSMSAPHEDQFDRVQHSIASIRAILEELAALDPHATRTAHIQNMVVGKIPELYVRSVRKIGQEFTISQFLDEVESEVVSRRQYYAYKSPKSFGVASYGGNLRRAPGTGYPSNQVGRPFNRNRPNNQWSGPRNRYQNSSRNQGNFAPRTQRQNNFNARSGNRQQQSNNAPRRQFNRQFHQLNVEDNEEFECPRQDTSYFDDGYDDYDQYEDYYGDEDYLEESGDYAEDYVAESGDPRDDDDDQEDYINVDDPQEAQVMVTQKKEARQDNGHGGPRQGHGATRACLFCDHPHHATRDCRNVTSLPLRKVLFHNKRICTRCERQGHKASECKAKPVNCIFCKGSDHCSSLCPNQDFQSAGQGRRQ